MCRFFSVLPNGLSLGYHANFWVCSLRDITGAPPYRRRGRGGRGTVDANFLPKKKRNTYKNTKFYTTYRRRNLLLCIKSRECEVKTHTKLLICTRYVCRYNIYISYTWRHKVNGKLPQPNQASINQSINQDTTRPGVPRGTDYEYVPDLALVLFSFIHIILYIQSNVRTSVHYFRSA